MKRYFKTRASTQKMIHSRNFQLEKREDNNEKGERGTGEEHEEEEPQEENGKRPPTHHHGRDDSRVAGSQQRTRRVAGNGCRQVHPATVSPRG